MRFKIKPYIVSILIALAVGGLSAFLTRNSMDVYGTVAVPPFAPPAWLFPVVWTVLYILMGISAAMIYTDPVANKGEKEKALTVYAASLAVNFFWSIIFFRVRAFLAAFLWLLLLLGLILKTIWNYKKINPIAAYLQIPYAAWVTIAGYLNLGIWLLNRA